VKNTNPDHIPPTTYWSMTPKCTQQSKSTPNYCVFTSSTFASGRGISILTSPEHAEELTKLPAFADPTVHRNLGVNQLSTPPFVARQMKGRGIGLVANRTIMRGEWLMSFTPAFMMPQDTYDAIAPHDRLQLQRLAIQQLPHRLRNSSESLFGQGGDDFIDDMIGTNSFSLTITTEDGRYGVQNSDYSFLFPEIAVGLPTSRSCRRFG
jgi:hypothetical protein